jgi:hypothetical protein
VIETLDQWTPVAITLSDSADNLLVNGRPFRHLANRGTSGVVNIIWQDGTTVSIPIAQYSFVSGGRWARAKSTGTTGGVDLVGCK